VIIISKDELRIPSSVIVAAGTAHCFDFVVVDGAVAAGVKAFTSILVE
jgi:hypothetical protein